MFHFPGYGQLMWPCCCAGLLAAESATCDGVKGLIGSGISENCVLLNLQACTTA